MKGDSKARSVQASSEAIRLRVETLIRDFESELRAPDLRAKVRALIPIFRQLRRLGRSLIPSEYARAARNRILFYFQKYPQTVIAGDELLVVSGIQEYARRVRELRVQLGWPIMSGVTIRQMRAEDEDDVPAEWTSMRPSDYVLLRSEQDRDAAHRWHQANAIRKGGGSVRTKILEFLRANVGREVTNEELRYVANNRSEWARRVRELRTEEGWPVVTKSTGEPDLPVGVYVLRADSQAQEHDRHIPDPVRRSVLRRDGYRCVICGWSHQEWNRADPRHLELHHRQHHAKGGGNDVANLRTLCNICHDEVHAGTAAEPA